MNILINASLLSQPAIGISVYLNNLIYELRKTDAENKYYFLHQSSSNPVVRILSEQFAVPDAVKREKIDLYHNPDHMLPWRELRCKSVITVHDLAFYKFPSKFGFLKCTFKRSITPRSIKRADAIIAVSQSTKNDILAGFDIPEEKVSVVYNGVGGRFFPQEDKGALNAVADRYDLNGSFILSVGTLEPRKNIPLLIEAFAIFKKRTGALHKLVIVGNPGWLYENIFSSPKKFGVEGDVEFLQGVESEDLPLIYQLADLFVYPSLYEGFGLPPLEAMACGTPVITSNVSSLPEVVGDAGILIDPSDAQGLAGEIEKVLGDKGLRMEMSRKGIARSKLFSWEKCARETIAVYNKAMGE